MADEELGLAFPEALVDSTPDVSVSTKSTEEEEVESSLWDDEVKAGVPLERDVTSKEADSSTGSCPIARLRLNSSKSFATSDASLTLAFFFFFGMLVLPPGCATVGLAKLSSRSGVKFCCISIVATV